MSRYALVEHQGQLLLRAGHEERSPSSLSLNHCRPPQCRRNKGLAVTPPPAHLLRRDVTLSSRPAFLVCFRRPGRDRATSPLFSPSYGRARLIGCTGGAKYCFQDVFSLFSREGHSIVRRPQREVGAGRLRIFSEGSGADVEAADRRVIVAVHGIGKGSHRFRVMKR